MAKVSSKEKPKAEPKAADTPLDVVPSEKVAEDQYLSADHLRQLEVLCGEVEIAKLTHALRERDLAIAKLELELRRRDIETLNSSVATAVTAHRAKTAQRTALVTSFKEVYGVADSFAYDPETGKITKS